MNIPKPDTGFWGLVGIGEDRLGALGVQLGADLVVALSYLSLLLTIVFLNRQKHIAIYLPKQTGWILFAAVLLVTIATSFGVMTMRADAVLLVYKLFVAVLMIMVVAGVLRLLPRDIDPVQKARLARENQFLRLAERQQREAVIQLRQLEADIDGRVAERTKTLLAEKLALEKEIVERRLIEERSVESKRRLEELILRTNTAMAVLSFDGVVLEGNRALAQFLGRGAEDEIVGRHLGRLLGLKDDTEVRHFLSEAQSQGTYTAEIEATPPDRGKVALEASGVMSVIDGRSCITALIRDVTERRAAALELMESREAMSAALDVTRKANAVRSDFLAKMNHELRTPLNGIIGLSEIIRHKASGKTMAAAEARKLASNIHQSGRHLLSVVDDLLDLSSLDAGTRKLSPVSVSVRAEIEAALATMGTIAEKKRITLENRCEPSLYWVVDQRAFKQVLINLVNNAVKFSPPGKMVWVEVVSSEDALTLRVCDQGPGISDQDRERILEPFGRGSYALNNKVDGVGLGLAIVSELMKLQGGRIEIDSTPGNGATFAAVFPKGAYMDLADNVASDRSVPDTPEA
ncbi:MAG: PAS domain-containing sensor histidine kinase [Pseudomonadota bacterium]